MAPGASAPGAITRLSIARLVADPQLCWLSSLRDGSHAAVPENSRLPGKDGFHMLGALGLRPAEEQLYRCLVTRLSGSAVELPN